MNRFVVVCTAAIGLFASSIATAGQYSFDTSGSKVTFELSSTLHDFDGQAKSFSGSLDTDAGTGSLTIDATSLTTDLGPRDSKMHSFCLESGTYSTISFELTSIGGDAAGLQSGAGAGKISLNGNLTIRDMVLEVEIPTEYSFEGAALTLKGKLGMSWKTFEVPDPSILISKLAPDMKIKFKLRM